MDYEEWARDEVEKFLSEAKELLNTSENGDSIKC